jgi:hypothetical protein
VFGEVPSVPKLATWLGGRTVCGRSARNFVVAQLYSIRPLFLLQHEWRPTTERERPSLVFFFAVPKTSTIRRCTGEIRFCHNSLGRLDYFRVNE